jgi:dehydrogenase/reductase SDR family member 1
MQGVCRGCLRLREEIMIYQKTLAGKVALVTGATRQVGRGIAVGLAELGAKVYITSRRMKPGKPIRNRRPYWGSLENTMRQIEAVGGAGVPMVCDHSDDNQSRSVFARIKKDEGRIDILVNGVWAGYDRARGAYPEDGQFGESDDFWSQPLGFWDENFVGVRASYMCSALAAPMMIAQHDGLIVNITFVAGRRYMSNVAYGVSHAALDRMTADMAGNLRPHNVAAIAICPLGHVADKEHDPQAESGVFSGRLIAAIFNDPKRMAHSGCVLGTRLAAKEYGISDTDGTRPEVAENLLPYVEAYPEWRTTEHKR